MPKTCTLTVPSDGPAELVSNRQGALDAHHVRAQVEFELGDPHRGALNKCMGCPGLCSVEEREQEQE